MCDSIEIMTLELEALSSQNGTDEPTKTQIRNGELALAMAYAETFDGTRARDLRERAVAARRQAEAYDAEANQLENTAGQEYIEGLQTQLDSHVETATDDNELEARVDAAKKALADQYKEHDPTITEADFSLVEVEGENGKVKRVVMLTREQGIDFGDSTEEFDPKRSWNAITANANDERFEVTVNGTTSDTRKGMTKEVYRAFIKQKIAANEKLVAEGKDPLPLPDSAGLQPWTDTWLTGEEAGGSLAPVGGVREGEAGVVSLHRGDDYRVLRFRPAVVIE